MTRRPTRNPHRSNTKTNRSAHSAKAVGEIRVIGGDWRGRKLPVLDAEGLRPTSDRVRETLFNWLQFEIAGARCLDLFSGSGALAFEALSRGAKQVTLLELNPSNAKQLKQNLATLNASNAQVIQTDSVQWLAQNASQTYDVVFIDPPFNQNLMQATVDLLFKNGYLQNQHPCLYLEQEKQLDWPTLPDGWVCAKEKTTNQVRYGLFRRVDG